MRNEPVTTTRKPGSDEVIELPFKVTETTPVPSLEAEMLELINQERTYRGLEPLEADPELTEVARRHFSDMLLAAILTNTPKERTHSTACAESGVAVQNSWREPGYRPNPADGTYRPYELAAGIGLTS